MKVSDPYHIVNLACTYLKVPNTKCEWMKTAKQFYDRRNFRNAVGVIDGKHVTIQKPASGVLTIITSTQILLLS